MPESADLTCRLDFALAAARAASDLILPYYCNPTLEVERKRDTSPVTEADRQAELLLREQITATFPDDAILGEEFPDKAGTSGFRWILDPIDGTKSFIHGVPLFGTLIGVEFAGRCDLGVVRFPALDEVVYAARGHGAWWQRGTEPPRPARVSAVTELAEATFCMTNPSRWFKSGHGEALQRLMEAVQLARGWGDCYGHMLVATGRAEIMIDPAMNAWDAAALLPIVEEAGGCYIDWSGHATIYGGNGISVHPAFREVVLGMLRS